MDNRKHIPVGIFNHEIFIAEMEDNEIKGFGVLRYLSDSDLARHRDPDEQREYYKELWQQAVASGNYEESLDTFVEDVFDECDMDDEEMYPDKDDSDCQYISDEIREAADAFIEESDDVVVGTWESSGSYSPATQWYVNARKFEGFDFIFDTPEAKRIAKMYVESLKK